MNKEGWKRLLTKAKIIYVTPKESIEYYESDLLLFTSEYPETILPFENEIGYHNGYRVIVMEPFLEENKPNRERINNIVVFELGLNGMRQMYEDSLIYGYPLGVISQN